jgi:hypothetical protein
VHLQRIQTNHYSVSAQTKFDSCRSCAHRLPIDRWMFLRLSLALRASRVRRHSSARVDDKIFWRISARNDAGNVYRLYNKVASRSFSGFFTSEHGTSTFTQCSWKGRDRERGQTNCVPDNHNLVFTARDLPLRVPRKHGLQPYGHSFHLLRPNLHRLARKLCTIESCTRGQYQILCRAMKLHLYSVRTQTSNPEFTTLQAGGTSIYIFFGWKFNLFITSAYIDNLPKPCH